MFIGEMESRMHDTLNVTTLLGLYHMDLKHRSKYNAISKPKQTRYVNLLFSPTHYIIINNCYFHLSLFS